MDHNSAPDVTFKNPENKTPAHQQIDCDADLTKLPVILERGEHPIVDEDLPQDVIWILNRLNMRGYRAYLVGGSVRDLLLGRYPKDWDIATDAQPYEIQKVFANCRLIGKRFRIVHVYFRDGHTIEISTFRTQPQPNPPHKQGPQQDDNNFGSPQEDAWRRDLTINGLFFDKDSGRIIDYIGGLCDLQQRLIRCIGNPHQRYSEDPVRMIRTLRHAARHNFRIEDNTWRAIEPHAKEIKLCSSLRLYEEFLRDLKGGASSQAFRLMRKSGLMREWLPALHHWLQQSPQLKDPPKYHFSSYVNAAWGSPKSFWMQLAQNDVHIQRGMYISEHVLLASLMLPMLWSYIIEHYHNGCPIRQLWHDAIYQQCYPIYRDLQIPMRIWDIIHNMFLIYRRIHLHSLFPDNKKIQLNTPQLNYALQLFNLELDKYQQHKPPWLKQMILSLNDQQLGDATQ